MKNLDFNFPIVRDIEATRARHQKRIDKLVSFGLIRKSAILFLKQTSDDDLFESITYQNRNLFYYYQSDHWSGQKGLKAIKHIVNSYVRLMIIDYLISVDLPKSYDTAYYLLHQKEIDKRMKAVSKLIYDDFS